MSRLPNQDANESVRLDGDHAAQEGQNPTTCGGSHTYSTSVSARDVMPAPRRGQTGPTSLLGTAKPRPFEIPEDLFAPVDVRASGFTFTRPDALPSGIFSERRIGTLQPSERAQAEARESVAHPNNALCRRDGFPMASESCQAGVPGMKDTPAHQPQAATVTSQAHPEAQKTTSCLPPPPEPTNLPRQGGCPSQDFISRPALPESPDHHQQFPRTALPTKAQNSDQGSVHRASETADAGQASKNRRASKHHDGSDAGRSHTSRRSDLRGSLGELEFPFGPPAPSPARRRSIAQSLSRPLRESPPQEYTRARDRPSSQGSRKIASHPSRPASRSTPNMSRLRRQPSSSPQISDHQPSHGDWKTLFLQESVTHVNSTLKKFNKSLEAKDREIQQLEARVQQQQHQICQQKADLNTHNEEVRQLSRAKLLLVEQSKEAEAKLNSKDARAVEMEEELAKYIMAGKKQQDFYRESKEESDRAIAEMLDSKRVLEAEVGSLVEKVDAAREELQRTRESMEMCKNREEERQCLASPLYLMR